MFADERLDIAANVLGLFGEVEFNSDVEATSIPGLEFDDLHREAGDDVRDISADLLLA